MAVLVKANKTSASYPDPDVERHVLKLPAYGGQSMLKGTFMVATAVGSAFLILTLPAKEDDIAAEARWAELLHDPDAIALLERMADEALAEHDAGQTHNLDELL